MDDLKKRKHMQRWLAAPSRVWALVGAWMVVVSVTPGCASIEQWGRSKVYRPTAVSGEAVWEKLLATRPDVGTLEVAVGHGSEQVTVIRVPAVAEMGDGVEVRVLYLHGTFRHAFRNLPKTSPMTAAGMEVFVPDYRGWGVSSPLVPSEATIHQDAWAVWQALQPLPPKNAQGKPVRWVIYGHSMGSAVAVDLAARLKRQDAYCALVLESSFTNFLDVAYEAAGRLGRWLARMGSQRMAADALIGEVAPPVWFLHGESDTTVPMRLGRRLFDLAPEPKYWAQWPLGHSDLHTDETGRYAGVWRDIRSACSKPAHSR